MLEKDTKKDIDSFEIKLDNAKKILQTLMNPDITIENSVQAYENGMKELSKAQEILESSQLKINEIKAS
jgi:exodeoxyribonuclease VII small subunit